MANSDSNSPKTVRDVMERTGVDMDSPLLTDLDLINVLEPIFRSMQAKGTLLSMLHPEDTSTESAVRRVGWEIETDAQLCANIIEFWHAKGRREQIGKVVQLDS